MLIAQLRNDKGQGMTVLFRLVERWLSHLLEWGLNGTVLQRLALGLLSVAHLQPLRMDATIIDDGSDFSQFDVRPAP